MTAESRLRNKKAELVEELERLRHEAGRDPKKPISKRTVSLEVCDNPDYYAQMIKHPTSIPSALRLSEIRKAFLRLKKLNDIRKSMESEDAAAPLEASG